MNYLKFLFLAIASFLFCGCYTLLPPTTTKSQTENLTDFSYFYMTGTGTKVGTSSSYDYGTGYVSSTTKSVNPSDIISGYFIKQGYMRLGELNPQLMEKTLIISYGETGTRSVGLFAYTTEITIQMMSGKTNTLVCTTTAEGIGDTEADDVRKAIARALDAVFHP